MSHAAIEYPGSKIMHYAVDAATVVVGAILAYELFVHLNWVSEAHEELIEHLDLGLSAFFAVELIVRFTAGYNSSLSVNANAREFMKDKWNVFDVVLLSLALAPLVMSFLPLGSAQAMLLRGFRAARAFHGIKHVGHFNLRVVNVLRIARFARVFHGIKHVAHFQVPTIRLPSILRSK